MTLLAKVSRNIPDRQPYTTIGTITGIRSEYSADRRETTVMSVGEIARSLLKILQDVRRKPE
jgi:hypothetical protein